MQTLESVQGFANSQIAPQAVLPIVKSGWCLPTVLNFILFQNDYNNMSINDEVKSFKSTKKDIRNKNIKQVKSNKNKTMAKKVSKTKHLQ